MTVDELNVIKDLLLSNCTSDYDKKVILGVYRKIKDGDVEEITKERLLNDLMVSINELKKADPTYITQERIETEARILGTLLSTDASLEELNDASFDIDCLYYDLNLEPRKTDTVLKIAMKNSNVKGK